MTDSAREPYFQGKGVLLTRPAEQSAALAEALLAVGAKPHLFPMLEILPPQDSRRLEQSLAHLHCATLAIFISPNAARMGLRLVSPWPAYVAVAAVGQGTAKALHALGVSHVIAPQTEADSEHLLALPELQNVAGQEICIFRGESGRETLAETLRARGAHITYVPCYRRGLPNNIDVPALFSALAGGDIHAITAFSAETLDNLVQVMQPGPVGLLNLLLRLPLFVPHPRIAEHATALGFTQVITCPPGEQSLISHLVEYFAHE